jgi:predicted PurR-regulated permease PerM
MSTDQVATRRGFSGDGGRAGASEAPAASPAASHDAVWRRASEISVIGLFVIAVLWGAYVAQRVIVPVLLAWSIATIVLPIVKWLQGRGLPRVLAAVSVAVLLLILIVSLLLLLSTPLAYWLGQASYVGSLMHEKLKSFGQPMALMHELQQGLNAIGSGGSQAVKVEPQTASLLTTILGVLSPAITEFVLFMGAVTFYLIYRERLRAALVYFLRDRDARLTTLRTLNDIDEHMTTYFGTFTIVNVCLGVVTAILTWSVGLPNPLLWAALACVLNYIPYIGPAVVITTLGVVGLMVRPTLGQAAIAPLLYLAIVTAEGQFITPTLMGRRLELNPFAVFLAIAFCTWLWGPVGAFLAVPLLMALSVVFGHALSEEKPELPS